MSATISGISIQGKAFEEETPLVFFSDNKGKVAVIYGRNGTGKSTISRAFTKLVQAPSASAGSGGLLGGDDKDSDADDLTVSLIPADPCSNDGTHPAKPNVSVFNEVYIDQKIRIESDGIDAVLLFGDDIELHDAIRHQKHEYENAVRLKGEAESARDLAKLRRETAEKVALRRLRGEWADRSRRILNSPNATSSWKETLKSLEKAMPLEGKLLERSLLIEERIAHFEKLAVSERLHVSWSPLTAQELSRHVDTGLLSEVMLAPRGQGLQKRIAASLLSYEGIARGALDVFQHEAPGHCPLCQQEVEDKYRERLVAELIEALAKESDVFAQRLQAATVQPLSEMFYSVDPRLDGDAIDKFNSAMEEYNREVASWNSALSTKTSRLYAPLEWSRAPLDAAAAKLSKNMENIHGLYDAWNSEVDILEQTRGDLLVESNRLAKLELSEEFRELEESRGAESAAELNLSDLTESEMELQIAVQALERESTSPDVAIDRINSYMQEIFADAGRLSLKLLAPESSTAVARFGIESRGQRLRPQDLSIGERNILALTYFFTTVQRDLDGSAEGEPHWVIVDDPISSVDVDNRLGIHGFIEWCILDLLERSGGVRLVFMTHDISAARDIQKSAFAAVKRVPGLSTAEKNKGVCALLLENSSTGPLLRALPERKFDALNEYQELMCMMYEFALREPDSDLSRWQRVAVGNVVRRVLEAFSTFIYRSGILDDVLVAEYRKLYPSRVFSVDMRAGHRGFLHDSSHSQDRQTSIRDYGGIAGLSDRERIMHVRRVLGLMYALQETHVRQYLTEEACQNVSLWKSTLVGEMSPEAEKDI